MVDFPLVAIPLNTLWDFSRLMWHTRMGVESIANFGDTPPPFR
jgi:hypothetical protein